MHVQAQRRDDGALEIEGLTAGYGKLPVVFGVALEVPAGAIVTLIGPNGSGKSTVIKAVLGFADVHEGRIRLGGADITRRPAEDLARLGIAYVPQRENIFPSLGVEENLEIGAFALADAGRLRAQMARAYELFPRLAERRRQRAGTLSGGERQMLAIARALVGDPRLLLLDEPSAALSPRLMDEVFTRIEAIRGQGVAVLLAEQNVRQALAISDHALLLISGEVALSGSGEALARDETVVRRVLERR